MESCITQLVRKEHIEFGRSIKLGLFDSRKQWMAGEITFGDGPYGDRSTIVQVLKAKVSTYRGTLSLQRLYVRVNRAIRWNGDVSSGD
jgi:hypothetical protein